MLWQKLIGAKTVGDLTFVGSALDDQQDIQTPTYSLTSLSGGVASAPQAGDIVIACVAFNNSIDRNIQCSTSGYTEVADLYASSGNDCHLGVYYKVLTTAETSVAFNLGVAENAFFVAHVWRNQNSTPLDVTSTTATSINSGVPNAPAITTATDKAVVIAIGACAGSSTSTLSSLTVPSGMTNFRTAGQTSFARIGIASSVVATSGSFDPPSFGGGNSSSVNSFCAVTMALRPA